MAHPNVDNQQSVSGLAERFGSKREKSKDHQKEHRLSKADIGGPMTSSETRTDSADSSENFSVPSLMLKCVIIQKNEKGYGLTVSGDNPVYVQSVKESGAAYTAGVRQGDKIIKVNGTSVSDFNHVEVVKLIKSGHHVALTLVSPPPLLGEFNTTAADQGTGVSAVQSVKRPQSVLVKDNVFHDEKVNTIKKMLGQEKAEVERIKDEYAKNPNKKLLEDLAVAQKLSQDLEKQLWKAETSKQTQNIASQKVSQDLSVVENQSGFSSMECGRDEQKCNIETGLRTGIEKARDLSNTGFQRDIMNFDEDELAFESDDHQNHGPFQDFEKLKVRPAHTAVFLNYVFRSHDPSPLLLVLTVEQYRQVSSVKELLKLSEVISKTYLASNAPLKVDVDDGIAKSIVDNTTQSHRMLSDDTLRVVFDPAAQHALKVVKSQLNEFCKKREQGLSNCFGEEKVSPTMEHAQEVRTVEEILTPLLQDLGQMQNGFDDSEVFKSSAKLDALERLILHWTGKKKIKLSSRIGSMLRPNKPTPLIRQKNASSMESIIDEQNKRTSILGKLVPKKPKVKDPTPTASLMLSTVIPIVQTAHQDYSTYESGHVSSILSKFPDSSSGHPSIGEGSEGNLGVLKNLERGGSFRDKRPRSTAGKSNSDPDLNMVEQALRGNVEQSDSVLPLSVSNSSLSSSGVPIPQTPGTSSSATDDSIRQLIVAHPELEVELESQWSSNTPREVIKQLDKKECKRQEIINELLHTEKHHVRDLLILHLLFWQKMQSEGGLNQDELSTVFPNLQEILAMHQRLRNALIGIKERDGHVIKDIATALLEMFDGNHGEKFKNECAKYCGNQTAALEFIKERCKKDQKFNVFIQATERHPICRRLQLKDFVPGEFQRLTKYPLLLENIIKNTRLKDEAAKLKQVHKQCKEILRYVNKAVKDAEDYQKIVEIQKNLDSGSLNKVNHPIAQEYKNIDLTARKLVHQGPLTWRITQSEKKKSIVLHCVLFEDIMVLLQKQEDRYVLKCHTSVVPLNSTKEEKSAVQPPILKLSKVLVRNVATDKKAFYVLSNSEFGAQIYELVAASVHEMQEWLKIVSTTAEVARKKDTSRIIVPGTSRSLKDSQTGAAETIEQHGVQKCELMEETDNGDGENILKRIHTKHEEIVAALVSKHNLLATYAGIEASQLDNILDMSLADNSPDQSTIVLRLLSSCKDLTSLLNESLTPDTDFIQPTSSQLLLPTPEFGREKSNPSSEPSTPKPSTTIFPSAEYFPEDLCTNDVSPGVTAMNWNEPPIAGDVVPSTSLLRQQVQGSEVPNSQNSNSVELLMSDYETASEPSSPASVEESDAKARKEFITDKETLTSPDESIQSSEHYSEGATQLSAEKGSNKTSLPNIGVGMPEARTGDGDHPNASSSADNVSYSMAMDTLISPIPFDTDLLDFRGHALSPHEVTLSSSDSVLRHETSLLGRTNPMNLSKLLEIIVGFETQLSKLLQSIKDSAIERERLLEQIAELRRGQSEEDAENIDNKTPNSIEFNTAPNVSGASVLGQSIVTFEDKETIDDDGDSRR